MLYTAYGMSAWRLQLLVMMHLMALNLQYVVVLVMSLQAVSISHDGQLFMTGATDGVIRLQDWKTHKVLDTVCRCCVNDDDQYVAHSKRINKITWSFDDKMATSVADDAVYYWGMDNE